jgi:hypothetical protein
VRSPGHEERGIRGADIRRAPAAAEREEVLRFARFREWEGGVVGMGKNWRHFVVSILVNAIAGSLIMLVGFYISVSIRWGGVEPLGQGLVYLILMPLAFVLGAISGLIVRWAVPLQGEPDVFLAFLPGSIVALILLAVFHLGAPW